ncbi:MAG: GNAT family protein [Ferruginibacter sp.]
MIRMAISPDFDFLYDLYMHPQVNPYLLYELMDAASFRSIYDDLLRDKVKYLYMNGGVNTGMFKLIPLRHRNDHVVYLGGLAIHPLFAGKGEGAQMMNEIIEQAVRQNFLRIELSVSVTNKKAIALYQRAGFEQEGLLRRYTQLKSEHRFIDEILMSYIT